MNLRPSRADTKSLPTAELPSASVASRWVWRIIKWFSLSCVIVEQRYILTRRRAKNVLSFVAGINKISNESHNLGKHAHGVGDISETNWSIDETDMFESF